MKTDQEMEAARFWTCRRNEARRRSTLMGLAPSATSASITPPPDTYTSSMRMTFVAPDVWADMARIADEQGSDVGLRGHPSPVRKTASKPLRCLDQPAAASDVPAHAHHVAVLKLLERFSRHQRGPGKQKPTEFETIKQDHRTGPEISNQSVT